MTTSDENATIGTPDPGKMPTAAEDAAAEKAAEAAPDIADDYREMTSKGAKLKGEGSITPQSD